MLCIGKARYGRGPGTALAESDAPGASWRLDRTGGSGKEGTGPVTARCERAWRRTGWCFAPAGGNRFGVDSTRALAGGRERAERRSDDRRPGSSEAAQCARRLRVAAPRASPSNRAPDGGGSGHVCGSLLAAPLLRHFGVTQGNRLKATWHLGSVSPGELVRHRINWPGCRRYARPVSASLAGAGPDPAGRNSGLRTRLDRLSCVRPSRARHREPYASCGGGTRARSPARPSEGGRLRIARARRRALFVGLAARGGA